MNFYLYFALGIHASGTNEDYNDDVDDDDDDEDYDDDDSVLSSSSVFSMKANTTYQHLLVHVF